MNNNKKYLTLVFFQDYRDIKEWLKIQLNDKLIEFKKNNGFMIAKLQYSELIENIEYEIVNEEVVILPIYFNYENIILSSDKLKINDYEYLFEELDDFKIIMFGKIDENIESILLIKKYLEKIKKEQKEQNDKTYQR